MIHVTVLKDISERDAQNQVAIHSYVCMHILCFRKYIAIQLAVYTCKRT